MLYAFGKPNDRMGNYMGIRAIGFAGGSYALFEYGVFSRAGLAIGRII